MNKKGVALMTVVVVVVIISIITGTVAINAFRAINSAELSDFAREIKLVGDYFESYVEEEKVMPTSGTVIVDIGGRPDVYAGETVNALHKIKLEEIGLTSTKYGNEKEPGDVYVYSPLTKRIYYPKGVQGFYRLDEELLSKIGIKDIESQVFKSVMQDAITVKADKGLNSWINSLNMLEIEVPKVAGKAAPTVSASNGASSYLKKQDAKKYVYGITMPNPLSAFNVSVRYFTQTGEQKTFTYNIDKIDVVKPAITLESFVEEQRGENVYGKFTNAVATDSLSGLAKFKYANQIVTETKAKTFFAENGTDITDKNFSCLLTGDHNITLYAEDRAGNIALYYLGRSLDLSSNTKVGHPVLPIGFKPVKWTGLTKETEVETVPNDTAWYDYAKGMWPNAKGEDGSYFVWIPRFEYKIDYKNPQDRGAGGTISVNIIPKDKTTPTNGYKIHPAFTNGNSNGYKNGEWNAELEGIWIAKYEMSQERKISGVWQPTNNGTNSNDLDITANASYRMVSKPGRESWRNIAIWNIEKNCSQYNRVQNSHLIKNSEWGAAVYFAHSQYGKKGAKVSVNQSKAFMTAEEDIGLHSSQSTTGNMYGIFDMAGCAWEYVSAEMSDGTSTSVDNSSEKKTFYAYDPSANPNSTDLWYSQPSYILLSNALNQGKRYGDALAEVSSNGMMQPTLAWQNQDCYFPGESAYFIRGGRVGSETAGIFAFNAANGTKQNNCGFRVAIIAQR